MRFSGLLWSVLLCGVTGVDASISWCSVKSIDRIVLFIHGFVVSGLAFFFF